ncbi:unnamed protein product [Nezara viridula]|uniref:receptor protein-tyrosine kinase n=1 Tax=Nezara viridula TaxID=85310 RepID=A0A9P0EC60_NEZVI|nr:unnamed protein product [Nezara viridula]
MLFKVSILLLPVVIGTAIEHLERHIALTNPVSEGVSFIGEKLNISCESSCNIYHDCEKSFIDWYKNNTQLTSQSISPRMKLANQWLRIMNIKKEDEGLYGCFSISTGEWRNFTLIVEEKLLKVPGMGLEDDDEINMTGDNLDDPDYGKPYFTNYSVMHNYMAKITGETCTLSCPAYGIPIPDIKWFKDGNQMEVDYNKYVEEDEQWSFIIPKISRKDAGNYTCVVKNQYGTITHTSNVQVYENLKELPLVIESPSNITVNIGESANFECKVVDDNVSKTVHWLKHSIHPLHLNLNNNQQLEQYYVKSNNNTLSIRNVQTSDEGWYTCLVITQQRKNISSAWLEVTEEERKLAGSFNDSKQVAKPVFTKPDKMHKVVAKPAGNTLRLKCPAEGNPAPNITWTRDGMTPKRNLGSVQYRQWSITLEDVIPSDSGNYTCIVCNLYGCIDFSFKVLIQERYPHRPYIKEGFPNNLTVLVNSTAVLSCPLLSDLEPYIEWQKSANLVYGADNTPTNGTLIQKGDDNSDPEKLIIHNVTHEDEAWYTCLAGNKLGYTSSSAYLKVVDKLETEERAFSLKVFAVENTFILFGILCSAFFFGTFVMMWVFQRLKRDKLKKLNAIEAERSAAITQWRKKVIIDKQCPKNEQDPLLMPLVKIEKHRALSKGDSIEPDLEYELPLDSDWEFPRENLVLGETLGEGAFGKVVKAEAVGVIQPGITSIVAVKMLKEGHTDAEMTDLVSEMEIIKMVGKHINIINMLGCCTQGGPLYVLVEFAPHGNLRDFLRQHRPSSGYEPAIGEDIQDNRNVLTQKDLVSFAYQVARGMAYLSSKRCVHRDLAARNVLVSDNYVLKIADFGLARDVHSNDYYRKKTDGRLPVKWMAPEALFHRVYTTQSDVWSYGVLLWEIMSLGGTPYPSVPSMEKLFHLLRTGHRMEKPPCCSLEIYMMMRQCWCYQPKERPSFSKLVESLDKILMETANEEYLDLSLPQLATPPSSLESSIEQFPYLL